MGRDTGSVHRDGALDIVVADLGNGVQVLLGNGDGTFQNPSTYAMGTPIDIRTGDFDRDGNLDLVLHGDNAQGQLSVSFLRGNGDGTFATPVTIAAVTGFGAAFSSNLFVNDFNKDGISDLLVGVSGGVELVLGKGDGTFKAPVFFPSGYAKQADFGIGVGDFTSDGNTDVILSNITTLKCGILLGNGDGTLQPIQGVNLLGGYNGELGIVTGDLNSDGRLDFGLQEGGAGVEVFLQ